ncbi:MAG: hypothetical protein ABI847_16395 [Anaerolineales bacterium]
MTELGVSAEAGWEYNIVHTDRLGTPAGPQLALIWKRKYSDGTTDWDQISKLGREGWEMVNAFPVESSGTLQYLAFIFKRRLTAGAPAAAQAPEGEILSGPVEDGGGGPPAGALAGSPDSQA